PPEEAEEPTPVSSVGGGSSRASQLPAAEPARPAVPAGTTPSTVAPSPSAATAPVVPAAGARRHGPVMLGFLYAVGALVAFWLGTLLLSVGSVIVLVVVSMFLAAGLNPSVTFFMNRGVSRPLAVLFVITAVLLALVLFVVALVPVISDQVRAL